MRVVFDTNVYISAFAVPGGRAEEGYLLAVKRRFELFTSVGILTETAEKLRSLAPLLADCHMDERPRPVTRARALLLSSVNSTPPFPRP